MRIPSGTTDQYIYFVAVDATDLKTRETGLSSFTVYRSRNGGAAAAFTTPTINETDATNMPGVYELLLDEDMTIDSGDDSQEMVFHITHAGMAPVTLAIELYRPKITAGETITVNSGVVGTVSAVSGNVGGTVNGFTAAALADLFDTDSGTTYAAAVAGSVVKEIADNAGGSSLTVEDIADAVWDEARSGHTAIGSFGEALQVIRSGTAQAGGLGTITLDAGASSINDFYNGKLLSIVAGTGVGQSAIITDYNGATKVATVIRSTGAVSWFTTPDNTSQFVIHNAGPSSVVSWYDEPPGNLTSGAVKVDVIFWRATQPLTLSNNLVRTRLDQWLASTPIALNGSGYLPVDVASISDDFTAADNLEAALDGTGGVTLSATLTGLGAAAIDAIWDEVYEGTTTARQFLRLAASALWGKLSGAATTTVDIRDEGDTKNRISATVDADGNRTAVTLDKS